MQTKEGLMGPTADFCKAIQKRSHKRGRELASKHFDGETADVMGEVFGDLLARGVIYSIGSSLFDVPMNEDKL